MAERADFAIKLQKSWEMVTDLMASLEASAVKLVAITDNLTPATKRNGQLKPEVAELPKVRAHLAAARARIKEEVALTA